MASSSPSGRSTDRESFHCAGTASAPGRQSFRAAEVVSLHPVVHGLAGDAEGGGHAYDAAAAEHGVYRLKTQMFLDERGK
jgi:hypothetical protein